MQREVGMVHQRVPQRYVDGRWERDESAEVQIASMGNPLEQTGLLREGQAVELFNCRDYSAAALVFGDVLEKVSGVPRRHYYRGLLYLAEGYAAWDVADYGGALEKLKAARSELSQDFAIPELAGRAGVLVERISSHLPFLGKVRGEMSVEKVVDMLENARRRVRDQGRYDDGVARLYRAVEMHYQLRLLKDHGISTSGVEWDRVDEEARERFVEAAGVSQLPEQLGLRHTQMLCAILAGEDPEEDGELRNLLQQRNRSILAHGLEPIGEKVATRFLEYVDAVVDAPEVRAGAEHARLRGL
jgi:CRISPR-associated protein (TIGR02710 family)